MPTLTVRATQDQEWSIVLIVTYFAYCHLYFATFWSSNKKPLVPSHYSVKLGNSLKNVWNEDHLYQSSSLLYSLYRGGHGKIAETNNDEIHTFINCKTNNFLYTSAITLQYWTLLSTKILYMPVLIYFYFGFFSLWCVLVARSKLYNDVVLAVMYYALQFIS